MELSNSKIKKFLIFPEMEPCTFQPKLKKIKKSTSTKISYTSGNKNPKKFLIFSQKKAVLIFWQTEPPKKFFIFQ